MSAALEHTYRRALRWYPKQWRTRNEDVVVGTLLDVADGEDRQAPTKDELSNLRSSGISTRFGRVGQALPGTVRDRISAIAFGTGLGLSLVAALFSILNVPALYRQSWNDNPVTFGPFTSLSIILDGVWLLAFIAAVVGLTTVARILLVLTIPAGIVARYVSDQVLFTNSFPQSTYVVMLGMFALLALIGRPGTTLRSRAWMGASLALTIAGIAGALWSLNVFRYDPSTFFFDSSFFAWGDYQPVVLMLGIAAALIAIAFKRWTWATVAAVSTLPWLALWVSVFVTRGHNDFTLPIAVVLIALIAGAVIAFRRAGFRLHVTRA